LHTTTGIAYRGDDLYCDAVRLADVAAACGTPTYIYSAASILAQLAALRRALEPVPHAICYAVKTNSNLAVLGTLARAGCGFDIVSGGELQRLLRVGVDPARIVFAGVGKTAVEMRAALAAGIGTFNLESMAEADVLSQVATELGRTAAVALRVNPDVAAGAHRYISTGTAADKFGVPASDVPECFAHLAALPGLRPVGLHCHLGSQILHLETYAAAAARLASLWRALRAAGHPLEQLNLGGGLGIRYHDETPPEPADYAAAILPIVRELGAKLVVEPGRFLVGNAGVLVSRVLYRKPAGTKRFLVVDAGMNDLVRPSLYGAHHEILPLRRQPERPDESVDLVGPICESGDFLARDRTLARLEAGEHIAVCGAGAYGFSMSSNYNSRPRAAEVLVRDAAFRVVRERETVADLWRGESDW